MGNTNLFSVHRPFKNFSIDNYEQFYILTIHELASSLSHYPLLTVVPWATLYVDSKVLLIAVLKVVILAVRRHTAKIGFLYHVLLS